MNAAAIERFWTKVDKDGPDGCWLWQGYLNRGYGHFTPNRKTTGAHRVAYELMVGPIPEGLTLDHLCRNRPCVNPAHLEPVTAVENMMRGEGVPAKNARKTHCRNGHEFTPENTILYGPNGSWRDCRTCATAWQRAKYHADLEANRKYKREQKREWRRRQREVAA